MSAVSCYKDIPETTPKNQTEDHSVGLTKIHYHSFIVAIHGTRIVILFFQERRMNICYEIQLIYETHFYTLTDPLRCSLFESLHDFLIMHEM